MSYTFRKGSFDTAEGNNPEYDFEEVSIDKYHDKKPTKCYMLKHFSRLAVPSVITNIFSYMVMTVNTIFAG